MSVLVVAEHLRGQVRDVTRELITAGRELGPVTVAVDVSLADAISLVILSTRSFVSGCEAKRPFLTGPASLFRSTSMFKNPFMPCGA